MAALVKIHPMHQVAVRRLQNIKGGVDMGFVAAHSLAELYANLTRLPLKPRIAPDIAQQLISDNVLSLCEIISLASDDYRAVIKHLVSLNIVGGAIYDALILRAAMKANADQVLTLNARDFRRVYPEMAEKIVVP